MKRVLALALLSAAFAAEHSLDGLLVLPAVVSAGEELELKVLDPVRTPAGGRWIIAGVRAEEQDGRLRVRLPEKLPDKIAVRYQDPKGKTLVDVPAAQGVKIVSRMREAAPRLTACAPRAFAGQTVCLCGYFPPGFWNGLSIDGKPAGAAVTASLGVIHVSLPSGLKPGLHLISGAGSQVAVQVLQMSGEIDRNQLRRGQRTIMRLRVSGTDEPLPIVLTKKGPIRLEGGDPQVATTSGGPVNALERAVHAVSAGDFEIVYRLNLDACPCAGVPAPPRDPRGFIPARVAAVIPLAAPAAMAATAQALAATHGLAVVEVTALDITNDGLIVFSIPDASDVLIKVAALEADPRVRFAQPDFLFDTTAAGLSYARGLMRADRLDKSMTGQGVTLAIIDSGADKSVVAEQIEVTGASYTADLHGTLMAGVAAEVAPRARILGIKACTADSPQSMQARCASTTIAKGLNAALQKQARIINMSLGGPRDKLLPRLVDAAVQSGVLVVAAAGNGGPKAAAAFPAALDNVTAVTAVDAREALYAQANQGTYIDVAAPGVDIIGKAPRNEDLIFSGTSPAAAYVTGVAALLLQQQPALAPSVVQALLEKSAKDLGAPGKDPEFGSGLVDACRAATLLSGGARLCR